MKSMKDQYGSKRGEQVFYASMNKGKIKGVEKKKNGGLGEKSGPPPKKGPASQGIKVLKLRGGGMDMGASSSSSSGGGGGRDAGMGMGGKSRSSNTSSSNTGGRDINFQQRGMSKADYAKSTQTQNFGGRDTKTVTARKGPTRVPVIGPVSFVANKVLESAYHSKNLKEQKKEDVLGGEMLTQGKKTVSTPMGGGHDDGGPQPIQLAQTKVASTSTVPIPLMKVQPKRFPFEYKDGGLVRGSGKVLKDRVKKTRIY